MRDGSNENVLFTFSTCDPLALFFEAYVIEYVSFPSYRFPVDYAQTNFKYREFYVGGMSTSSSTT